VNSRSYNVGLISSSFCSCVYIQASAGEMNRGEHRSDDGEGTNRNYCYASKCLRFWNHFRSQWKKTKLNLLKQGFSAHLLLLWLNCWWGSWLAAWLSGKDVGLWLADFPWSTVDVTTLWVNCPSYRSTNLANSAFHPCGAGKWIATHVIAWISGVEIIKRQTWAACGCLAARLKCGVRWA